MPTLLEGKTALVLGVANRWSLAYAISQAFVREGAKLRSRPSKSSPPISRLTKPYLAT
jgi:enoyl-[acyl-carrier-protein] reductase (NADH)